MNSISSFKRLSEPAWKSLAVRHKVRDNGLAKALSECAKQAASEEYDGVLKSLVQVTDLANRLRKDKEIALNRDLCVYLDELAKDVGKARTAVAAEQKGADESEAEEAETDAEEKLSQALRVQLLAGFQKAKTVECSALVCVATPFYGLMVAQSITAKHKALLTQVTGSTKFLALCGFSWDQESSTYSCIMDKRDAALKLKLEAAIKYYTATSVKVNIVARLEYEESETSKPEEYEEKAYAPAKKSAKPYAGGDANEGETAEDATEPKEPDEEPLLTGVRPFDISGSVGQGGKNAPDDVAQVQIALNRKGAKLEIDGKIGGQTIGAIKAFQKQIGIAYPDGLVDVGKKTATALAGSGSGAKYADGGNGGGSGQYGGGGTGKYAGGGTGKYSGGGNGGGSGQYGGGGTGKYAGGGTGKYSGSGNGGGSGQYGGGGTGQYGGGGTGQYGGGGTGQYGGGGTGQYGGGGTGQYGGGGTGEYGGGPRQYETGGSGNAGSSGSSGASGEKITGQAGFSQPEGQLERAENAAGQAFEKQRSKVADTLEGLKNTLGGDPE